MRHTISMVFLRVDPPAPYVTEMKLGPSGWSSRVRSNRSSISSGVFGGKNSKEIVCDCVRKRSRIFILAPHIPSKEPNNLRPESQNPTAVSYQLSAVSQGLIDSLPD